MAVQRRGGDRVAARLVAVAVLGFGLFVPPLMSLFDRRARVLGVPVLPAYLFIAWALVIGLIVVAGRGAGRTPPE
jgi:hypothetical protein